MPETSTEATSGIDQSYDGGASVLDPGEDNFNLESVPDSDANGAYSDTLEQLCYKQKLNGFLRTALARGAACWPGRNRRRRSCSRRGSTSSSATPSRRE